MQNAVSGTTAPSGQTSGPIGTFDNMTPLTRSHLNPFSPPGQQCWTTLFNFTKTEMGVISFPRRDGFFCRRVPPLTITHRSNNQEGPACDEIAIQPSHLLPFKCGMAGACRQGVDYLPCWTRSRIIHACRLDASVQY